jgi:hypothetical protein
MSKKTVGAILAVILVISVVSVFALNHFQAASDTNLNSNLTSPSVSPSFTQSPDQQQVQTYSGTLISFNYTFSETSGVELTQLFFSNKTFNYPAYIPLENNQYYNVTYYYNNPNQALDITSIPYLPDGQMNLAEQATITNLSFNNYAHTITATIQNTGGLVLTITQVYVTGTGVTDASLIAGTTTIAKGTAASSLVINVAGSLTSGNEYTVKLVTSRANSLSYAQVMP